MAAGAPDPDTVDLLHDLRDHYELQTLVADPDTVEDEIARLDRLADAMADRTPRHAASLQRRQAALEQVAEHVTGNRYTDCRTWTALADVANLDDLEVDTLADDTDADDDTADSPWTAFVDAADE